LVMTSPESLSSVATSFLGIMSLHYRQN
jgi:hypothetical protein